MAEQSLTFDVVLKRDGDGWTVNVPDVPGCITCGDTIEEAEANAKEALEGILESMIAHKIPVPEPSTRIAKVTVIIPEVPQKRSRSA